MLKLVPVVTKHALVAQLAEQLTLNQFPYLKLLNKIPSSTLEGFSKSYLSQVKHGRRPPSQKLLQALEQHLAYKAYPKDYYGLFIQSREAQGCSVKTISFYKDRLSRFVVNVDYLKASRQQIESYLKDIKPNRNGLGTRAASYRALSAFYHWLCSEYRFTNPMLNLKSLILSKPILPSLEREQVLYLIEHAKSNRDRAIIALFTESGLRLTELANITLEAIDWRAKTIKDYGQRTQRGTSTIW